MGRLHSPLLSNGHFSHRYKRLRPRAVVVLTEELDNGTAGLREVKARGREVVA
jgi:hypothetical protein